MRRSASRLRPYLLRRLPDADQADLGTPTGVPSVEPPASILLLLSRAEDHRSEVLSDEQDLFSFGSQHKIEMADSEDTRNYHGRPGAMRVYGSGSRERLWEDRPVHAGGISAGHAAATVDGERPDRGNREPHTR